METGRGLMRRVLMIGWLLTFSILCYRYKSIKFLETSIHTYRLKSFLLVFFWQMGTTDRYYKIFVFLSVKSTRGIGVQHLVVVEWTETKTQPAAIHSLQQQYFLVNTTTNVVRGKLIINR